MNDTTQRSALAKAIDFDTWSPAEQLSFMTESGRIITDAAVNQLLLSLTESEVAQLELYLDTHEDIQDIVAYLSDTYPRFNEYLKEEVLAFQAEAEYIVSARS